MAIDVYASLNLHQNQVESAALENLATPPGSPVDGQAYFDTALGKARVWNGTAWEPLGGVQKFAATIGDGVALAYPVTHNLGTLDTVESVFAVATGQEEIAVITHTSLNVTTFTFTVAPALNAVRVVIQG